jgi:hypothetical protein
MAVDALVPLLVVAVAVWSRLGRRRRDDVGRAVEAFAARLRDLAVTSGSAPVARSARAPDTRRSSAPPAPAPVAAARPGPAAPATPPGRSVPPRASLRAPRDAPRSAPRSARREVVPAPERVREEVAPAVVAVPARGPSWPAIAPGRRRLDVGRDLIAAELLAPPVSLRSSTHPGGPAWR